MQYSDILFVLHWWLIIFIIGLVFLSFINRFFHHFFDQGYIFSKTIGIAIVSYTVFLLGTIHVLPFSQAGSVFIVIAWFLIAYVIPARSPNRFLIRTNIIRIIQKNWPVFVFEEIIFLVCLFFWAYIRSFAPDIHGLEKYMDFGFVNSIIRSTYFPPRDMWFTPLSINYYYFGHLVTAVLTKLSGIPSFITFNLMLATLFALAFTASFSIGANLVYLHKEDLNAIRTKLQIIIAGFLSAFLVTLAGNLHILYAFFKPYQNTNPVPFWQLPYNPTGFPNEYWYPNATRFIYNTIHEFPIYSWVVSDLHGHVLDIPFVLTTIALLLAVISKPETRNPKQFKHLNFVHLDLFRKSIFEIRYLLLLSFLLAVMYMTNASDGGIYLILTSFVILYLQLNSISVKNSKQSIMDYVSSIKQSGIILNTVYIILSIVVCFLVISLPFSLFFDPALLAHGIGILCAPSFLTSIGHIGPVLFEPNHCQKSPLWQLAILYGFFAFFAGSFMVFLYRLRTPKKSDIFIFLLIVLATMLIIIPEYIYVKDIYPANYRANTMFKLVFQAFIMLSLVSGYTFIRFADIFRSVIRKGSIIGKMILALWLCISIWLFGLVGLYPYLAIMSYYGNLQTYHGLNGTTYLHILYPTDYAAITWINSHITGQPVILEAQGDSYTDYARVSSNTGLPTVLGWTVHEWLWRGSYAVPEPRISDVQTMYISTDAQTVKDLLQKYDVRYVFVGDLEREKYPGMTESVFKQLGQVIFQKGTTRIYKIEKHES